MRGGLFDKPYGVLTSNLLASHDTLCKFRLWGIKSKVFASLSAAELDIRPLAHSIRIFPRVKSCRLVHSAFPQDHKVSWRNITKKNLNSFWEAKSESLRGTAEQ